VRLFARIQVGDRSESHVRASSLDRCHGQVGDPRRLCRRLEGGSFSYVARWSPTASVRQPRYEKRSIALTSNIHAAGFDELMPKTLATA